jgi:4-amino-4-deoxy-L-arabinose transferase-like glycosyltransferase
MVAAAMDWQRGLGWAVVLLVCLALFGSGTTRLPPVDRDEARYAQASRQMLESQDFVRIRFQDQPRHKKPIGIYWMQAASAAILSPSDHRPIWPYRVPSLLGALLAVVLTVHFGRTLFDRKTATIAGLLLASCLLLTMEAHLATTDAMLLATVIAAQSALGQYYLQTRQGNAVPMKTALTFWVAQGLGWLLKGPIITFVSMLTIGALCLVDRRIAWLKALGWSWGPLLMAAMLTPWAVAVLQATHGTFFQDAVRSDLLPKLLGGQESHGFPPGYFLLLMPFTFWPASLFAGIGLQQAWRRRTEPAERFCLAWCLSTWLAFEIIPTKLPHYILPAYPALALLGAQALHLLAETGEKTLGNRWLRLGAGAWGVMSGVFGILLLAIPWWLTGRFRLLWLLSATSAVIASLVALKSLWTGRLHRAVCSVVVGSLLTFVPLFHSILPTLDALWLSRGIADAISHHSDLAGKAPQVVAAGYHEPSLVFLLGTDTKLLSAEMAACYLREIPQAVAVVSEEVEAEFLQILVNLQMAGRVLDTIHGLNYTKGRRQTIKIYAASGPHGQ